MKCLLDMDGVLVNFVKGACKVHRKQNPYTDPANHGVYDMASLWGITIDEFWAPFDEEWWDNLEPTAEMDSIIKKLNAKFGEKNVAILSSPPSGCDGAMAAKKRWIEKFLPQFRRRFLFGPAKEFCAKSTHVLVDDYDKNVSAFDKAGGHAILLPRPWNRRHADHENPLKILDRDLAKLN